MENDHGGAQVARPHPRMRGKRHSRRRQTAIGLVARLACEYVDGRGSLARSCHCCSRPGA